MDRLNRHRLPEVLTLSDKYGGRLTLEASMREPIFNYVPRDERPRSYTGSAIGRQEFGRRS